MVLSGRHKRPLVRFLSVFITFAMLGCGGDVSVEDVQEAPTPIADTGNPTNNNNNNTNTDTPITQPPVNTPPYALIINPAPQSVHIEGQTILFAGSGTDIEDGNLSCDSLVWVSGTGVLGTGCQFSKSLNMGTYTVILLVKDSKGATSSSSVSITVIPANAPPNVLVTIPGGTIYNAGDTIDFTGSGADSDGVLTDTSYVWVINGTTTGGDPFYDTWTGSSFITNTLSPGIYNATLTVTDSGGQSTSSTVTVTIEAPAGGGPPPANTNPVAIINSPLPGSQYLKGEPITFYGKGMDPEDGNLSDSSLVWWIPTLDGAIIGTGSFIKSDLVPGTHTITLTVTDSGFANASTSVNITVKDNTPPTASINSPINGDVFSLGDMITFAGNGTDTDGTIKSLMWTSDGIAIGIYPNFSTTLSEGPHTITLMATDNQDATDTASITITVIKLNTSPTATIYKPADGSNHTEGTYIDFSGVGFDADAGDTLTLIWAADGVPIGVGNSFSRNDLSQGAHTISLTVKDSKGATGTAFTTINVVANGKPSVTITSPLNGSTHMEASAVTFSGTGYDAEDGSLSGNSLVWTSGSTVIGTGTSFTKSDLAVGNHTIALIAIDKLGSVSVATITITIKPLDKPPVVSIAPMTKVYTYSDTLIIAFSGSATDPEDGALSGNSLVWTSSMDGPIGTGTNFTWLNPSVGTRTVVLTATDSAGNTGYNYTIVTVNPINDPAFKFADFFVTNPNENSYWTIHRNAGDLNNEAVYDASNDWFYLTKSAPDLGVAAFANYDLAAISSKNWQADFDYRAGGGAYGGGDGFVFMFYKNKSCYNASTPAVGGDFGFICSDNTGGEGYGIEFDSITDLNDDPLDLNGNKIKHIALITNSVTLANHLEWKPSSTIDDTINWHHATIVFNNGYVEVYIDDPAMSGSPLITHTIANMSYAYSGIGFGAGTALATNNHIIDTFTLKILQ